MLCVASEPRCCLSAGAALFASGTLSCRDFSVLQQQPFYLSFPHGFSIQFNFHSDGQFLPPPPLPLLVMAFSNQQHI